MPPINIISAGTGRYFVSDSGYRSREQGVVESGQGKLGSGMIMAQRASGLWGAYVAGDANYGTAKGILLEAVDATTAPVRVTFHVRDMEAQRSELLFSGAPTTPQKDAAYASLAVAGIAFR